MSLHSEPTVKKGVTERGRHHDEQAEWDKAQMIMVRDVRNALIFTAVFGIVLAGLYFIMN
ncbi:MULTISPECIES: hypothetical protein [unclassified Paenibacillus]|uniref:hypothetical protein n=1 Tax=unclassified Paenibacillus TaxID=185978 RepID=UPI001C124A9B|nr:MULTISPECIES: hypothetical protein [unclassified Paenibacillus]MBU5441345.1 hypothetical protein [Paenibacillus sp. MSJ-34]CAH0120913.1 hypothetical protein PAE9249_03437 [Paenibacillus sp. CECT 9249]